MVRRRMTGEQRRDQLMKVGRSAFAERGFEGISVEEIGTRAGVSKPVIYEHFGGKEGLYRAVADQEIATLVEIISQSIQEGGWRERVYHAVVALLTYAEQNTDGFIILARGQAYDDGAGSKEVYTSLMHQVTDRVTHLLVEAFPQQGIDAKLAPLYAQGVVGTFASVSIWWLNDKSLTRNQVAAHLYNLVWNGLGHMSDMPALPEEEEDAGGKDPAPGFDGDDDAYFELSSVDDVYEAGDGE
ncbi:TetR/AcrR family transcriptional regulator [Corynebacterium aquatimens]|uniref:AcrR family transcriptional regulator n=1 Tax=Corynebacterium aquatimens TaxID=1190508 RepID=A0A931GSU1_9CORY|nr:TetR/AcrR family transcriptional regulator [Corynebacterium aquatimens]MBG6121200.1 AcrR family transcriptional regulator [Corynebacterium aquatimens]WJY66247.1 HTH-type transcriptional repressor AcnR [Corynebacterium aquatimens]